jgi:IS5 family transposase
VSRWEWKWFKRRSAIEPIFGHLKSDNKLERNHLKGKEGDRINAILAGCGFNMRKLIRAFFLLIIYWLKFGWNTEMKSHFFAKIVAPVS